MAKTSTKEKLLLVFEKNKGKVLSGEALAGELKVSRAAVWKAVKELQKQHHNITSTSGSGYVMAHDSNVLTKEALLAHLNNKEIELIVQDEITSTNTPAKEMAANGAPHGSVVVANTQTAGRGRLDRVFKSPPNTGLYISCVLKNNLQITDGMLITVAAAVAVCRSVQKLSGKTHVKIKWVNDLYVGIKKCGGILCEASTDIQTGMAKYVVVGIGLNLFEPQGGFDKEIADIATSIFEQGEKISRSELAASIVNELLAISGDIRNPEYMQEYKALNIVKDRAVTVLQGGKQYTAFANGITDDGHLCVTLEDGQTQELSFGEVSLKL